MILVLAALLQATPAAPVATRTEAQRSRTVVGEVQTVDAGRRLVTIAESLKTPQVKGDAGKRDLVTVSVDASTQLVRGANPTTFEDLKVRDHVVVRYLLTPTGPRAVSLRVAEVARTPAPAPTDSSKLAP